ncbi:MAG: recombinase RecA [Oscillospiraceae bacterium]|nr:recombinase RecA [Oscillospiraceae bacterium]
MAKAKAKAEKKNLMFQAPATAEEKQKALDAALKMIEKTYGAGAVMRLGQQQKIDVEVIPTGSLQLDLALGVGGVPRGRIVELYGPESSGKTTVALHIVAEAQKRGGNAAFIDVEHALDPKYAKALGVDIDNLLVSQPDSGEQALEIAEQLVRSGAIDVLVVDSVAAMTTKAEIEGEMGDNHVGQLARLMSQALRKLTSVVSKTGCVAIFINQIREKIGVLYGNPETTPGGRALKFYATVRMDVRKGEVLKEGGVPYGNKMKVKIVKNKVAPPFRECDFENIYGQGINRDGEIIDLAVDLEIVKKSGSWFSYNGEKLGQGRDSVKKKMNEDAAFKAEIEKKIMDSIDKIDFSPTPEEGEEAAEAAEAAAEAAETGEEPPVTEAPAPADGDAGADISADEDFEEFDPTE